MGKHIICGPLICAGSSTKLSGGQTGYQCGDATRPCCKHGQDLFNREIFIGHVESSTSHTNQELQLLFLNSRPPGPHIWLMLIMEMCKDFTGVERIAL